VLTDRLGGRGTVSGGGRYDGLVGMLGGNATAAVGWAGGIERLAMLLDADAVDSRLDAVIAVEDDAMFDLAMRGLRLLRENCLAADIVATGSPRKRFDKAAKIGARALLSISLRNGVPYTNAKTDGSSVAAQAEALFRSIG